MFTDSDRPHVNSGAGSNDLQSNTVILIAFTRLPEIQQFFPCFVLYTEILSFVKMFKTELFFKKVELE